MTIAIAIASIYFLAGVGMLMNRALRTSLCPICVGVSGTWIWMLVARAGDVPLEESVILLLMGGSVVGMAYWLERRTTRTSMVFKLLFIPSGLLGSWALIMSQWPIFAAGVLVAGASLALLRNRRKNLLTMRAKALQEQMKQCC